MVTAPSLHSSNSSAAVGFRRIWRTAPRTLEATHLAASALFAASLAGGVWCAWIGRGFAFAAWSIVLSGAAMMTAITVRLLVNVFRHGYALARRRSGAAAVACSVALLGAVGWSATVALHRFGPSENLLTNHDQGMYLGAATHLARTGSLAVDLKSLATWDDTTKDLFLIDHPIQFTRGSEPTRASLACIDIGFPLADQSARLGPALPHFPPGFATVLGSAAVVGGWPFARMVNWSATVVGVLSLAWIASQRFGVVAGYTTGVLLAMHPLLTWAANRHFAEPLLFALWTTGLAAFARHRARSSFTTAFIGGFVLTVSALVKIDAACIACGLLFGLLISRASRTTFAGALSGVALGGVIVAPPLLSVSSAYLLGNASALASHPVALSIGAGAATLVSMLAWARVTGRHGIVNAIAVGCLGTGIVVALALYLGRQNPVLPDTYYHAGLGREILSYREDTLRRLDWYWLPFGFVPALAGVILLARHRRHPEIAILLTSGLLVLVLFGFDLFCDPRQPYAMRRLAVFGVPLLLTGLAAGIGRGNRVWVRCLFAILAAGLALGEMRAQRRLSDVAEYAGTRAFCETLIAALPDDAVVLVPKNSIFAAIAMQARYRAGREVWIIRADKNNLRNHGVLAAAVDAWRSQGRRIVVLGNTPSDPVVPAEQTRTIAQLRWKTTVQPGSYTAAADRIRSVESTCYVNELVGPPMLPNHTSE